MNELLAKLGLDFNSLNREELETLDRWSKSLAVHQLTLEDIKTYVSGMITSLERELYGNDTPKSFTAFIFRRKRNRSLQARLYNYILLRDFLTAPDRARSYVEKQMKNLSKG